MTESAELAGLLDRLGQLHPKSIDLSLGRIERLLARLGHPERRVPPAIHVAGTNGKGSTIAYLRAGMRASGHRAHVYTSPHLVRFNERIELDGRQVSDARLIEVLSRCEAANAGAAITFFEVTTAAALLAFSESPAEVLLLEVGLGGRLDTTNVVPGIACSVITPVSMDHMSFLGDTLEKIAFEKAGILRPGVPAVIAAQRPEAMAVIERRAEEVGAPLLLRGRDWDIRAEGDGVLFRWREAEERLPAPALLGAHQVDNAGTALAALHVLSERFPTTIEDRAQALTGVRWPARLQRLTHGPIAEGLPEGWAAWLDGGHNEDAARAISATVRRGRDAGDTRPLHLVFGSLSNREPAAYLSHFRDLAARVWAVTIPGDHETHDAEQIVTKIADLGLAAEPVDGVEQAIARAMASEQGPASVLICGSLYLAGEVLRDNG